MDYRTSFGLLTEYIRHLHKFISIELGQHDASGQSNVHQCESNRMGK